jgi:hypothetical protein
MQELNFSKNILLYQYQEYTDLLMINFHWDNCLTVNFKSGWGNVLLKSIMNNCFILLK